MPVLRFSWNPLKALSNIEKHRVSFPESATVFQDPYAISIPDLDHGAEQDRWITIGFAFSHRLLVVVHTINDSQPGIIAIRIISARRATKNEQMQYNER